MKMTTTIVVLTGLIACSIVSAVILFPIERPLPPQAPLPPVKRQLPQDSRLELIEKRCLFLADRVDALTIAVHTLNQSLSRPSKEQASLNRRIESKAKEKEAPKVDRRRLPDSFEALRLADLDQRFGLPDSAKASSQHYYKEGVAVQLDEVGLVDSVTFHGQYSSDQQDVNGNYLGLFQKDGAWYRPKPWNFKGLTVGDSLQAVLTKLGLCDQSVADVNGNQYLHYLTLQMTVKLSAGPRPVVLGFRFGSLPSVDVNGNVGF